ncbi:MAG: Gfo/Idh/MocA family oxidoreductase [Ruminococcaceae bacterium]|nr:Gfo/Idh/MocA family oxidoreductase [Oscillospiraceae bacterium]
MRIVIVGMGVIGRVHLKSLCALGTPPVAVCDVDVEKARAALLEAGLDLPVYGDYQAVLCDLAPDAVHICTPHYCHADMVVAALEKNVHVLCEKPLAISEQGLSRVLAAEASSTAQLGVCQQNRYNAATLFFKDYIKDKPVLAAHGSVVWHRSRDYYRSGAWRGKWKTEGGGVMINQALHTLDLCQWLLGTPTAVTGQIATMALGDTVEVEDTVMAHFEGPVPFSFFATVGATASMSATVSVKLEQGELCLWPHRVTLNGQALFEEPQTVVMGKPCYGIGHVALMRDFYAAIGEKRPFAVNGATAATVIRLILALYRSHGARVVI